MSKRIDCHRPGAIVPADYFQLCDYILPGSDPFDPPWNLDILRDTLAKKRAEGKEMFGGHGRCGVCGSHFRHGTLFQHEPTGDVVHMGHDCAAKYEILADHDDWDAANEMITKQRASAIQAKMNADRRASQLAANPGLVEAFACANHIVQDIKRKFEGSNFPISDKQIALVLKIAREETERKNRPEETKVPAPEGRQTIRGILVSKKVYDGPYGSSTKGTIKVTPPEGIWLAWGTLPAGFWNDNDRPEVGDEVELTGTLKRGNEPHFALFKRPTAPKFITRCEKHQTAQTSDTYTQSRFRMMAHVQLTRQTPADPFADFQAAP